MLRLWDVRDTQAHIRALAAAGLLDLKVHHLEATKREDLVEFLFSECWRISGLTADGQKRKEYVGRATIKLVAPRWSSVFGQMFERHVFTTRCRTTADARDAARALSTLEPGEKLLAVDAFERRPRGAYDPTRGLAFSTYSRKILEKRIIDWYRDTFGDNRYGEQPTMIAFEWPDASTDDDAGDLYDRLSPGARPGHIDRLNLHAYEDPFEEVIFVATLV